ncbi:MAG: outer membrane protein, partial [Shewanella sp.]
MKLNLYSAIFASVLMFVPQGMLKAAEDPILATSTESAIAAAVEEPAANQWNNSWGIGIGKRRGDIPYATEEDEVYDTLPLIYFKNEYFYINGMEAAGHIWKNDNHQVNLYTRFRFVDIPQELQNDTQSQAFDFGFQYRFVKDQWDVDLAILSDSD